uniref:Uncharacterized protein n=1 Tax=Anguilla anguilla TaxID=7936 RepID=A0A0E9SU69_ANGAN
MVFLKLSQ